MKLKQGKHFMLMNYLTVLIVYYYSEIKANFLLNISSDRDSRFC